MKRKKGVPFVKGPEQKASWTLCGNLLALQKTGMEGLKALVGH